MIKWRAMVYLTISYVPWIVYWGVSAAKEPWGTWLMLALASVLVGYGYSKQNISSMDLVAVIYALVAITGTYLLDSDLFIVGDGYIGYGTLFLLGIISIILKRPFLEYYVKKDIPKGDIETASYYTTGIWTFVFLVSKLIFLGIETPVIAVISSNIFVAIGIVLSIIVLTKQKNKQVV